MRATNHNGRTDAKGRAYRADHNDRNFTSRTDTHILRIASGLLNEYYAIDGTGQLLPSPNYPGALKDHEKGFYNDNFAEMLEARNGRYLKQRHPERCRTMQAYYEDGRTCPEESILQIGKMGEVNAQDLESIKRFRECLRDYLGRHARRWPSIRFLDAAIHADEASLHAHVRKVYIALDKYGMKEAAQNRCLQNMGFSLPDPDRPRGQYNNLKMTYTEQARALWLDVCQDHGYQVERMPAALSRKAMELDIYKQEQERRKLQELREQVEDLQEAGNVMDACCFFVWIKRRNFMN